MSKNCKTSGTRWKDDRANKRTYKHRFQGGDPTKISTRQKNSERHRKVKVSLPAFKLPD